jgi:segregation and condensation protein B
VTEDRPQQAMIDNLTVDDAEARAALEALLFVASDPIEVSALSAALGWSAADVEEHLSRLADSLRHERRGIVLQRQNKRVQIVSAPRFGPIIERFLAVERRVRLSEAALETLAILAFRQPATRAEIEAIRGVDCSGVLTTLVAREMIEVVGRRQVIGNPLEYGTTDTFLRQFGLTAVADLVLDEEDDL